MPVFRVKARTLASGIDAISKKYRSDKGRYWTSAILPSHDARRITVRAVDGHSQNEHKCWASFDIKELVNGAEVSASVCTNAHPSVKLKEQVLRQLAHMYPAADRAYEELPSQEDADSIMSGWSHDESASPSESGPAAPTPSVYFTTGPEPVAPAAPQTAPAAISPLETLEAALGRIARLERGLTETNSAVRLIHEEMQRMTGQVQLVGNRVEGILSNLKATLGYRAHNIYVCGSCHSKGEVSARVKCTHCGQENWWGWWPSPKSRDDGDSVNWLWERLR